MARPLAQTRYTALVLWLFGFGGALLIGVGLFVKAKRPGLLAFVGKKTVAISDAIVGEEVTIKGVVEVIETVTAPFSERPCAAYELKVDRKQVGSKAKSPTWIPMFHDNRSRDFLVVDKASNRTLVDGAKLEMQLKFDTYYRDYVDEQVLACVEDDMPAMREFMEHSSGEIELNREQFRVQEAVLEAGVQVTVRGVLAWEADPKAEPEVSGYRHAETPKRLRITGIDGTVTVRDR